MPRTARFQPAARRVTVRAPQPRAVVPVPTPGRKLTELVEKVAPLADEDVFLIVDSVTGQSMRVSLSTLRAAVAP